MDDILMDQQQLDDWPAPQDAQHLMGAATAVGGTSGAMAEVQDDDAAIAASDVGVGGVEEEQARRSSRERRQVILTKIQSGSFWVAAETLGTQRLLLSSFK